MAAEVESNRTMAQQLISIERKNSSSFYATLDLPPRNARAYALFAHCFTGLGSDAHLTIIPELVRHSIGVLSLDVTGYDNPAAVTEPNPLSPSDLQLACDYLSEHHFTPQLFIGHSLASFAVLPLAASITSARAVVSISTPSTNDFNSQVNVSDLFSEGSAAITIEKTKLHVHHDLVQQIQDSSDAKRLQVQKKPLLLLHAPEDATFDYKVLQQQSTQAASKGFNSIISVDNGDHKISSHLAAHFCASMIASWGSHFLFTSKEPNINAIFEKRSGSEQDMVVISESRKNTYQQKVSIGDNYFFADQSQDNGGNNTGPDATQLLLSAIGSSTTQTIREYAQLKNWPLDHTRIELRLARNRHNPEAAIPSSEYIILEIELSGNLDNIQRNSLIEVAENCRLHQHLETKILIRLQSAV